MPPTVVGRASSSGMVCLSFLHLANPVAIFHLSIFGPKAAFYETFPTALGKS